MIERLVEPIVGLTDRWAMVLWGPHVSLVGRQARRPSTAAAAAAARRRNPLLFSVSGFPSPYPPWRAGERLSLVQPCCPPPSSSPVRANGSVVHPWLPTRGVDCGGRTRSSCPQSPADDFETHSEARPLARMAAAAPMWWGKRVPFLLLNLQLVRLLNLVKFVEVFRGKYLFQYSASMNM